MAAPDTFRGYGAALSAELPHAVRVPNLFHVVRLRFARRRCAPPRATTYPWASRPPLYGIRRARRAAEDLTTTAWARLLARIDSGVLEIGRLVRAITTWRAEFLAYFSVGRISDGPTQAVNVL